MISQATPTHFRSSHLPEIIAAIKSQNIEHVAFASIERNREHQVIIQLLCMDATGDVAMADKTERYLTVVIDPFLMLLARLTYLLVELLHWRRGQSSKNGLCFGMCCCHVRQEESGKHTDFVHENIRLTTTASMTTEKPIWFNAQPKEAYAPVGVLFQLRCSEKVGSDRCQ